MSTVVQASQSGFDIQNGKDVLLKEAACITSLAENLNGEFSEAVALLYKFSSNKGRVIVTVGILALKLRQHWQVLVHLLLRFTLVKRATVTLV